MMASVAPGQWSKLLLTLNERASAMLTLPLARLVITTVFPSLGDAGHAGPLAGADHADLTAKRKVEHRYVVGTGVGHVGAAALRIHVDEVGPAAARESSQRRCWFPH